MSAKSKWGKMEIDKEEIDSIIKQLRELSIGGPEDYLIGGRLYERAMSGLDMDLLSDLYYNFGLIRFDQNDWQQAIKSFNRSIEYSPKNKRDALINLGASKSEQGDQVWALNDYQVAERMGEADDADLLNNIGVSHARLAEGGGAQDSFKTAIEYFNRSLVLKPDWEVAQDNLRTCADTLGTYQELLAQQTQLKEERPLTPDMQEIIREESKKNAAEILQAIGTVERRLPPSESQIKNFVDERLGSELTDSLPRNVRQNLIKAERFYRTKTDIDESIVCLCKAVEGTLWHLLGLGLYEHIKSRIGLIKVVKAWIHMPKDKQGNRQSRRQTKYEDLPVKRFDNNTGLTFWNDLLDALSSDAPYNEKESAQATDFGKYVASNFNEGFGEDVGKLVEDLRAVQMFRGNAAHFNNDFDPEESEQLETYRDVIFGTNSRLSLIKRLVELFKSTETLDSASPSNALS